MKKNIVIIGRADHDNFGDSLMFAFYVKAANDLGIIPFLLGASEPFLLRLNELGLKCELLENTHINQLDAGFFIGGGYFGEPDLGKKKWHKRFLESSFFHNVACSFQNDQIPYYIMGVEVGPLSNEDTRAVVGGVLAGAEKVVVRNKASVEFIKKTWNIECIFFRDVVLAETVEFFKQENEEKKIEQNRNNKILIHATGKILKNNLFSIVLRKNIVRFCLENDIQELNFVFDQTSFPDLIPKSERISRKLSTLFPKVEVSLYSGVQPTLEHINHADYVLTTKLHIGVVALGLGKNVCCISSMPKNKRFYAEIFSGNGLMGLLQYFVFKRKIDRQCFVNKKSISINEINSSKQNILEFQKILSVK